VFPWKSHLSAILHDRFFSGNALRQGEQYAAEGRAVVEDVRHTGNRVEIVAAVQGHARRPYWVKVAIDKTGDALYEIAGECTCPMGFNCKHVAAAIRTAAYGGAAGTAAAHLIATMNAILRTADKPAAKNPEPPSPALSFEVQNWLDRFQPAAKTPPSPHIPEKRLVFVLNAANVHGQRQCHITLMRQQIKKSGEQGKAVHVRLHSTPADFLADPSVAEFADLLRRMFGQFGFTPEIPLDGNFGDALLRQLLETGRTYWKNPIGQPLRLGDPRPARPVWRQLPGGSQQATFETDPPTDLFLPLTPPWYLDAPAGICGPLQVEGDPANARRWLLAPIIAPEQATLVANSVANLPLPAPRPIEIRTRKPLHPTPVLRLEKVHFARLVGKRRADSWREDLVSSLDVARVFFEYEGIRVAPGDNEPFASRLTGAVLERIPRMPRIERQRMIEASESGLHDMAQVLNFPIPDEVADAFSMIADDQWAEFMVAMVPGARDAGWKVEIDPSFSFRPAAVDDWYAETHAPGAGEDWFGYELGIVVEGQQVNLLPFLPTILSFLKHIEREDPSADAISFRIPDGRIVQLPVERLRAIAATLAEIFDPDALANNRLQLSRLRAAELVDLHDQTPWRGPDELRDLASQLRAFNGIAPLPAPGDLRATLRPYQLDGLAWLQFLREHHFGGILADDMGLGKTLQVLAHLPQEKNAGRGGAPSLVVAPTSLMAHWRAQAERFAPSLRTLILHGGGRKERFDRIPESDLVVTSYALLPRDQEILARHSFHLLILDEAQYIKNPRTKAAEILRSLRADHRLCMTGTPMENHLGELWSLMHFLSPGYLGSEKQFRRIYRDPIEKAGDADRRSALARRIRPFILRRRKEDVAAELPPKTEILRNVELDGDQRDLYETLRLAMHEKVRAEVEKRGLSRAHIVILDALLKLRQVCCDPRLVKLERARKAKGSAKLELLADMLPSMIAEGRRILLFSQFTSMLDLIEPELGRLDIPFVRLDGSTTDRETPVNTFQAGAVPLFLISLKAGGTGLNLTAADTVIHYDPWWNPAVERQATDRAHRIGQDKPVFVYKLVTTGTVEEKILAMQERKKELVNALLGEGAQQTLQLSREDLDHLFTPLA
jgi:hypothetical protein